MRTILALALLLPATALAIPMQLTHQGRLFDNTGGALDGSHDVSLTLYDAPSTGTNLWSETQTVTFDNGYYTLMLGADSSNALDASTFDGDSVFLGIAIDSGPELPGRAQLVSVPYAYRALNADTAVNLSGGVVDATEIRINGTTVITDGDPSLTNLGCADGDTIVYAGGTATCVPEVSPRTDAEIVGVIAGEGYGLDTDIQQVASDVAALTTLGDLTCAADGQVARWDDGNSAWICEDAMVATDVGLTGDGTTASPLAPDWEYVTHNQWGGTVLEGEGPLASNVTIGANASDPTASGGMVRLGAAGDTGGTRLYGVHRPDLGHAISNGPARVVVRAKVSDNTGTGSLGALNCTANRGAWAGVGATIPLTPGSFAASDEWQEFETWCAWRYDDADQFVGWDGFDGSATTDLSIDHVRVYPSASAGPQIWRSYSSSDVTVGAAITDIPGLSAVTFDLKQPSRVKITYSGMIIRPGSAFSGQHCAVWMYLDGSTSPISNRGGYGTGFVQLSNDTADNWWVNKDFHEVVDLAPGRHTLRVAANENWGGSSDNCLFSNSYGSQLIIEAVPRH